MKAWPSMSVGKVPLTTWSGRSTSVAEPRRTDAGVALSRAAPPGAGLVMASGAVVPAEPDAPVAPEATLPPPPELLLD